MDTNGDGIGDLSGIAARLDYVASLGVDAIWLSPFFASPMDDFGYDISDHCAVDPVFGTLADFDRLLERAHELGLRVVIDQVYSHTSDRHRWFTKSRQGRDGRYADWYVWADARPDGSPPNNWQSVFFGASWTWDARRRQYYLHNFLPSQPDLNLHNPEVQAAILDVARFWLDRGVDGFRLDAINFAMHDRALTDNPPVANPAHPRRPFDFQRHIYNQSQRELVPFFNRLSAAIRDRGADHFTVAEIGGEDAIAEMHLYTQGSDRLDTAYGFEFLFADRLTPDLVTDTLAAWPGALGEGWPSWAFSNHDAPRAVTRWGDPARREEWARLLLVLLMTLRGNIFLYQGEELGLPQADIPFERLRDPEAIANWPLTQGRDGSRTPMPWDTALPFAAFSTSEPWLPIPPAHRALAVSTQEGDRGSPLALTRRLIAVRRSSPALRLGDFRPLDLPAPMLGFDRKSPTDTVRCVFNLGDRAVDGIVFGQGETLLEIGAVDRRQGKMGPLSACLVETPV